MNPQVSRSSPTMATLMRWLSQGFLETRHMPGISKTGEQVPVPTDARALETATLSSVTPSQAAPHAITFVHDANGPYHSLNTVPTGGGEAPSVVAHTIEPGEERLPALS